MRPIKTQNLTYITDMRVWTLKIQLNSLPTDLAHFYVSKIKTSALIPQNSPQNSPQINGKLVTSLHKRIVHFETKILALDSQNRTRIAQIMVV